MAAAIGRVNRLAGYTVPTMRGDEVTATRCAANARAPVVRAFEEDLCCAFANTRYWRGRAAPVETLADGRAVLDWCETHGGWTRRDAQRVAGTTTGETLLAGALEVRETLFTLFAAVAADLRVPAREEARLVVLIGAAPPRGPPARLAGGHGWTVAIGYDAVPTLLAPVLWSAADLLTRSGMRRIRACGNPECRWLFLDRSKSGTRRWCDMGACGNRAKAERHYRKMRDR